MISVLIILPLLASAGGFSVDPEHPNGSEYLQAWSATNGWVRYWNVQYDVFTMVGEPKHGLWKWQVEGADLPIWWCETGGPWDKSMDSFDDFAGQQGMREMWVDTIAKSKVINQIGTLAKRAKLDELAIDVLQVELFGDASIWYNYGTSEKPVWHPHKNGEVYLFTIHYGWDDIDTEKWGTIPNMFIKSEEMGANIHTMVAVVVDDAWGTEDEMVGIDTFGLHYAVDSDCPGGCGESDCDCDAVLIDMKFTANLDAPRSWEDRLFYQETPWTNPVGKFIKKRLKYKLGFTEADNKPGHKYDRCNQFTSAGRFKCTSNAKKQEGMNCFFNFVEDRCTSTRPDLECDDYNTGGRSAIKRNCKKLASKYGSCMFKRGKCVDRVCSDFNGSPSGCSSAGCKWNRLMCIDP